MSFEVGAVGARTETGLASLRRKAGFVFHPITAFRRLFSRQRVSPHCAFPSSGHIPNNETRRAMRDAELGRGLADWENLDELVHSARGW